MSNFSQFFLNTSSKVVRLDLLEFSHPDFSKLYRIVRNAVAGVSVTLEDTTTGVFAYYPVKLSPTGSNNDLDQSIEVLFGDLGQMLPQELDRTVRPTSLVINGGACIGVWADSSGNVIGEPFLVGNGGQFFVPYNATALQVGMNDGGGYSDNQGHWNISINGGAATGVTPTNRPWTSSGGLNPQYPYNQSGSTAPVQRAVTPGSVITIAITLTAGLSSGSLLVDGFGDPSLPDNTDYGSSSTSTPGVWVHRDPNPGSIIKPTMIYRSYRSDDLTAPLDGPYKFQVNNISFKKEGATFSCGAPRLNYTATGEVYTMDRFPMLKGFL